MYLLQRSQTGEDKALDKVRHGDRKQDTMLGTPLNDYYYPIESIKINKLCSNLTEVIEL